MSLEEDLDLTDYTDDEFDDVDKPVRIAPGWYRAVIEVWDDSPKFPGTYNVVYKITDGPHVNQKVYDTVWDPQGAADTTGADKNRKRRVSLAKRLGLVSRQDVGGKAKVDWHSLLGMEVIIQVVQRTGKDGAERAQLSYMGIYPATDSRGIAHLEGTAAPTESGPAVPPSAPRTPATRPAPRKDKLARPPIDYSTLGDIPL